MFGIGTTLLRFLLIAVLTCGCALDRSIADQDRARAGALVDVNTAAVLPAPQSVTPSPNQPQDPPAAVSSYARLAAAIAAYRQIAALGGWPPVPSGEVLKTGSVGPRVVALRSRLSITGDLTGAAERLDRFDADLAIAVRIFQARHGLEEDAIVGRETLRALNVPVEYRLSSMLLNLTRLAKQEAQWGNRYLAVNAAAATYRYVEDGIVAAEGPVVVGRSNWQTPEVDGVIDRLEFNPYWLVPPRIAALEVWPKAHRDPAYLKRNHMQIVNGQIRQDPGADNPLGKVKFLFTNAYSVYLHDTNHPELLAGVKRFSSHGCIRVSGALDLARLLLRDDPSWPEARIQDAIDQTHSVRVDLKRPIPVHVVYNTAWVDETGRVQFRDDVYDRDAGTETPTAPRMDLYGD